MAVWGHRRGRGAVHTYRCLFLLPFCGIGVGVLLELRSLDLRKRRRQAAQLLAFSFCKSGAAWTWSSVNRAMAKVCKQNQGWYQFRMKEAFSSLPALLGRCCKMPLSSYTSCAGGHRGRQFGVGQQVCACEEGSCSEKEKHGHLLICRMETSEVTVDTEHSKCGRKRGPCRAHGGDASLRGSQWPSVPFSPRPVSPGHSWPAASRCW